MNITAAQDFERFENAMPAELNIVGEKSFNNDLLCSYLKTEFSIQCHMFSLEELKRHAERLSGKTHFILLDRKSFNGGNLQRWLKSDPFTIAGHCWMALFNASPEDGVEHTAINHGLRGVLYANDPINDYHRALTAIAGGELWYPRRILEKFYLTKNRPSRFFAEQDALLTSREIEILRNLASGKSNQQIADCLNISHHTVKTHTYNIFKKIKVTNRLQAALWLSNQ